MCWHGISSQGVRFATKLKNKGVAERGIVLV